MVNPSGKRSASVRLQPLLITGTAENAGERIVSLVTGVLVEQVIELPERDLASPGLGVGCRVLNRELVEDRLLVDPRETLDHLHVLRGRDPPERLVGMNVRGRFVMVKADPRAGSEFQIVLNWAEEFRQRTAN